MNITPMSWHSDCTATATPEDEPPEIMIALSASIMRLAEARAASDLVWVSPVTKATFLPRMPLPLRLDGCIVDSMPPSPSPFRCLTASWKARSSSAPSSAYGPDCGTLKPSVTVPPDGLLQNA